MSQWLCGDSEFATLLNSVSEYWLGRHSVIQVSSSTPSKTWTV
jgi:hypothetical protein